MVCTLAGKLVFEIGGRNVAVTVPLSVGCLFGTLLGSYVDILDGESWGDGETWGVSVGVSAGDGIEKVS